MPICEECYEVYAAGEFCRNCGLCVECCGNASLCDEFCGEEEVEGNPRGDYPPEEDIHVQRRRE